MKPKFLVWLLIGLLLSVGIGFSTFINLPPERAPQPISLSTGTAHPTNLAPTDAVTHPTNLAPTDAVTHQTQPVLSGAIRPGAAAPNFKLPLLNTNLETSLTQYQGDAVLLNFWSSWCDQCQLETPLLEKTYQQEKAKGLVILGIDLGNEDTLPDALNFMRRFGVTYPLLLDHGDAVTRAYLVYGIPTSFFISRAGKIQLSHIGSLNEADLQMSLSQILGH